MYDYDDEPYDCGFDLPDNRHSFYSNGELVKVNIVRHWYQDEYHERTLFKVSFDIVKGKEITHLPIGCDESKARDIAHQLYEQTDGDIEDSNDWNDTQAIYDAERRMGA